MNAMPLVTGPFEGYVCVVRKAAERAVSERFLRRGDANRARQ
jgi:hypothetical protein